MTCLEQVAQDNHLRAQRLTRDLSQIQEEYLMLKAQVELQDRVHTALSAAPPGVCGQPRLLCLVS